VRATIFVTIRQAGFHFWPDAPETVGYLRDSHRHVFTVRAAVHVVHDDRDVEYMMFQREMRQAVYSLSAPVEDGLDFGSCSCEHLARGVLKLLRGLQPRTRWVEVWEDDENGARVEADADD